MQALDGKDAERDADSRRSLSKRHGCERTTAGASAKELRARSALPGIRQNRSRSSGDLVAPEGGRIGARAGSLWPQTSDLRELTLPLIFVGCG